MIENWKAWITTFDEAVESSQWESLRPLMLDEVTYTVSGVPFSCHLTGADAVLSGFERSITNFDRHFDQRQWFGVGVREFSPHVITARSMGVYRLGDKPLLHFSAKSFWRFKDGKIAAMQDCYDLAEGDVQDALAWLAEHGPDLDPRYAD